MPANNRKLLNVERTYGMYELKQPLRPTRYYFGTETKPYKDFGKREYADALELQASEAVKLHTYNGKTWWWFEKQVYVERDNLTAQDVTALALQMQRAKDATLEVVHAEMRGEDSARAARPPRTHSRARPGRGLAARPGTLRRLPVTRTP
jgi:hypothetical protein